MAPEVGEAERGHPHHEFKKRSRNPPAPELPGEAHRGIPNQQKGTAMYRTARVAIMAPEDTATVYLSGNDNTIPVIGFGRQFSAETFEINLNSQTLSPVQQVAWLRSFAGLVEDLAEQVERRHDLGAIDALREKLATQTPIYCDCGAHELSDRFAVVADPDEAGVTHDRNWCGNREAVAR